VTQTRLRGGTVHESRQSPVGQALHATTRFPRVVAGASRRMHVAIFLLSRGRIMGRWFGSPVLVLETVGRKTAKRRRTTITYCPVDGGYVVLPINAGSTRVPAWWLNLREAGEAIATVTGRGRICVRAREVSGSAGERLWARYAEQAPVIEQFREYAGRAIPVVLLEPVPHAGA
jgi:deazaflavin-dependent oxidoreductase (nitroreductase family)